MNWFYFIVILLINSGLFLAQFLWFHRLADFFSMNKIARDITKKVFVLLAFLVISISFLMINLLIHGVIIAVFILLAYQTLSNIFSGLILELTNRLKINDAYKIGDKKGILSQLQLTGLELQNERKSIFIPFNQVIISGVEQEKEHTFSKLEIIAIPTENALNRRKLLAALFMLPYLTEHKKIDIQEKTGYLKINLWLESEQFTTSLYQKIKSFGYTIQNEFK